MSGQQIENPFPSYRPVEAKSLDAAPCALPSKSSVTGKLTMINTPYTPPDEFLPRFGCLLRGVNFLAGERGNDYGRLIDDEGRQVVRNDVRIDFLPDVSMMKQGVKKCLENLILQSYFLVTVMSKQLQVDVSGGTVKGLEGEGSQKVAVIECMGSRVIKLEGGRVCRLVLAPKPDGVNQSATTANSGSWLKSPSPPPAYTALGGSAALATGPNLGSSTTANNMLAGNRNLQRSDSNTSSTDNRRPLSDHLPNFASLPKAASQAADNSLKRRMSGAGQEGAHSQAKKPKTEQELAAGTQGSSGMGGTAPAGAGSRGAGSLSNGRVGVENNPPAGNTHYMPPPSLPSHSEHRQYAGNAASGHQIPPPKSTQSGFAATQRVNLSSGLPARSFRKISGMRRLLEASGQQEINVFGIIIKSQNARKTYEDWMITLIITDETVEGPALTADDFQIAFFCKEYSGLPQFPVGTPILFRDVLLQYHQGKPRGQGRARRATWVALEGNNVKYMPPSIPELTPDERSRLEWIRDWRKAPTSNNQTTQIAGSNVSKKPDWQLKDIQVGRDCFFNYTAKVIQVFDHQNTGTYFGKVAVEVYLADGTIYDGSIRNYHNAGSDFPNGSVVKLSIFTPQDEKMMRNCFKIGNVIKIPNVRPQFHDGALELAWNENLTEEQQAMGWRAKRIRYLDKDNFEVIRVDRQITKLLGRPFPPVNEHPIQPMDNRGSQHFDRPSDAYHHNQPAAPYNNLPPGLGERAPATYQPPPPRAGPSVPANVEPNTSYEGLDMHGYTPLAEICTNLTVPNKFKVRARVLRVETANKKGGGYTTKFCKKCNQSFNKPYCGSCNDSACLNAELRYRLTLFLTTADDISMNVITSCDSPTTLTVLLTDDWAAAILPPLPPVPSSINIDKKKVQALEKRLAAGKAEIDLLLMGESVNGGPREHPAADWELESYTAKTKGHGGRGKESVVMYAVSGREAI